MTLGIHEAYRQLNGPDQSQCLPLSTYIRVGLNTEERVYIFIGYEDINYTSAESQERKYELIQVDYNSALDISGHRNKGIIISFLRDREIYEDELLIFLAAFEEAINQIIKEQQSDDEKATTIKKLLSLFNYSSLIDTNRLKGWWGELFLIYNSTNQERWIESYHMNIKDPVDFMFPDFNIEVKSFTGEVRRHLFSTSQSVSSNKKKTYLASVKLTSSPHGESFENLLKTLRSKFPNRECLEKMYVELQTLKELNPRGVDDIKYEIELARKDLLFFNFEKLRLQISNPLIERAKYTLNLSSIEEEGFVQLPEALI
jgi:hypothetical protein